MSIKPMVWRENYLEMLDQRELPHREVWLHLTTPSQVAAAIRDMAVRGAPAIGIAAAYGIALAAQQSLGLREAEQVLAASRPTAVNLFWALQRMAGSLTCTLAKLDLVSKGFALRPMNS